jgi:ABC-type phosphate transport system permease subunit
VAAGLALFVLTLVVNLLARLVVRRTVPGVSPS